VRAVLRTAILEGKLAPGTRLREEDIASQFNMSRGPVREALRELELEGLVKSEPHRGTFVSIPTPVEVYIKELYSLRSVLEGLAARLVASDPTADLSALQSLVSEMQRAAQSQHYERIVDCDMEFHRMLCQISHHSLLNAVYGTIHLQMKGLSESILPTVAHRMARIVENHQELVNVLRCGDPDAAEQAVRRHVLETGERLLRRLQGTKSRQKGGDQPEAKG
jgi:DNA-binding GntR family transcriptional regulator